MTGHRTTEWRHDCGRAENCFIQGLPSWDDIYAVLRKTTGRPKLAPTDIDGMVEINSNFLFIEEKPSGCGFDSEGQRVALLRLSRLPGVTVLAIRPALCSEVESLVFRDGVGTSWQPRSRQQLLDWISDWARDADTKELGT